MRNNGNVRNHSFDGFSTSSFNVKSSFTIGAWYYDRFKVVKRNSLFCRRVKEILGSKQVEAEYDSWTTDR